MSDFTHLHLHTPYSLLDGYAKIDKLLDRALEYGMDTVAITDHGVMFGAVEFFKKAKKRGIKAIIGCEIYITAGNMEDKSPENRQRHHLVLLAENEIGYKNLIKIVSEAFVNGYYYKPRADHKLLEKHSEGIICLSACLTGEIQQHLLNDNYEEAQKAALRYKKIFGKDNFFLEVQDHGLPEQKIVNRYFKRMSKDLGIPLVATNDVHYVDQEDARDQDVLLCIGTAATINQENRMRFPNSQFYFKSGDQMAEIFKDMPEAIENTRIIADRCNFEFKFHEMHLPYFKVDMEHDEYLKKLVYEGISRKYDKLEQDIIDRANNELKIIKDMGFTDYFLIVWDFIDFAKRNKIPVGPGRGSAAGSIVSYALDITGIDPLKYDLLFERFLNPERVSMPDIDIDFCYERREEVIEYVKEKYGDAKVAQIATFGTMAARNAIRDVGRVLDVEYSIVDKIAKQVPQEINMTIEKALEISEDFKNSYKLNEDNRKLIDTAKELEGLPRHVSTHAAGVVISSDDVDSFVPLVRNGDQIATQYNMIEIEELGLLKMDFLGLRTLTVINDAVKLIKYNHGIDVDIDSIDINDKKAIKIFTNAETIGIFQFESAGMRRFLKDLRPNRFDDLIAANSLFRPGPMNEIPNYIRNRHNPKLVTYLTPELEPILKTTYGIIVFQEQVMQIVQQLAGFSLGEADNLRRAMGKKKMEVMEENREYFVNGKIVNGEIVLPGCVRNGINPEVANQIYDLMIDFAKYAFNKSHSAAYSMIAMQTAWLKAYYPNEFMAALLSSVMGNISKVYLYIKEAKSLGISVLPANVNFSYKKFSVEYKGDIGKIRIGLSTIKTVGENLVDEIIEERKKSLFKNFEDFIERMVNNKTAKLNKRSCEALIYAGALDGLGLNRAQMINISNEMIDAYNNNGKTNIVGQEDMFSMFGDDNYNFEIPNIKEFSKKELLRYEKEYLGVYISDHPYGDFEKLVNDVVNFTTLDIENEDDIRDKKVIFGGIITGVNQIITRKNEAMAFINMEDIYGSIEVIAFPKIYNKYKTLLVEDKALLIRGNLQTSDTENPSIIINEIKEINVNNFSQKSSNNVIMYKDKVLYLRMKYKENYLYKDIRNILVNNKGDSKVIIYFEDIKKTVELRDIFINLNNKNALNGIIRILGSDNVIIK